MTFSGSCYVKFSKKKYSFLSLAIEVELYGQSVCLAFKTQERYYFAPGPTNLSTNYVILTDLDYAIISDILPTPSFMTCSTGHCSQITFQNHTLESVLWNSHGYLLVCAEDQVLFRLVFTNNTPLIFISINSEPYSYQQFLLSNKKLYII
jgi:hypothetical protein